MPVSLFVPSLPPSSSSTHFRIPDILIPIRNKGQGSKGIEAYALILGGRGGGDIPEKQALEKHSSIKNSTIPPRRPPK